MKTILHSVSLKVVKFVLSILELGGFSVPPVVAVCAVVKKGNEILAIDLNYNKGLALPGGRIEREENLEEGLIREIKEETGLNVKSLKYFSSYALPKNYLVGMTACFFVTLEAGELKDSFEGKVVWVTPKEFVRRASYKDNKHFVEKLL